MRTRLVLGLALAAIASAPVACTDRGDASVRGGPWSAVPRNSDGSPQVLPPGPPSRPPHTLVLRYQDFGPPSLAGELLGVEWWQWEGGGSWEPGDRFDVRVVVYRGISRAAVEAEYRTLEGHADYRYVRYDEAMAYLQQAIAEVEGEPSLRELHEALAVTGARLRQALADTAPAAGSRARAG